MGITFHKSDLTQRLIQLLVFHLVVCKEKRNEDTQETMNLIIIINNHYTLISYLILLLFLKSI